MNSHYEHVVPHPRVVVIFWGDFYRDNPEAVPETEALVSEIVTGRYMNQLVQYGVGKGRLLRPTFHIDDSHPKSIDPDQVWENLRSWIKDGRVQPAPAVNEENLVYLILAPSDAKLPYKDHGNEKGYHHSNQYRDDSDRNDAFWAIIGASGHNVDHSGGLEMVASVADVIGHELVETFTDRDSGGFRPTAPPHNEIADPCKGHEFQYGSRPWKVEDYWSVWHHRCINGDREVSMRQFLKSISFDTSQQGLRSLGGSTIDLEYLASKMRSLAPASME